MALFCRVPMISPEACLLYQLFSVGPLWKQDGSLKGLDMPSVGIQGPRYQMQRTLSPKSV
jgi:hypothetical protein